MAWTVARGMATMRHRTALAVTAGVPWALRAALLVHMRAGEAVSWPPSASRAMSVRASIGGSRDRTVTVWSQKRPKRFCAILSVGTAPQRGGQERLARALAGPARGRGGPHPSSGGGAHAGLSPLPAGYRQSVSLAPPGDRPRRAAAVDAQGVCRPALSRRACRPAGDAGGTPRGRMARHVHQTGGAEKPHLRDPQRARGPAEDTPVY